MTGAQTRARRRAGFTLVEVTIASGLFLIIGWVLVQVTGVGVGSAERVSAERAANAGVREAVGRLADELRCTSADQLTVTALPDGNQRLDFRVQVLDGASTSWGVYDAGFGSTAEEQNQVGWSLRYTVEAAAQADGSIVRTLVRQVLDTLGDVQEEDALVTGLRAGDGVNPGLALTQVGDVWELVLSLEGEVGNGTGRRTELHVRLRN
ncbi:MAG: hypothetical protein H6828_16655 [Planctomycetes bacterium]|nr:hypothetical protein [Planctomycetota bacterium]